MTDDVDAHPADGWAVMPFESSRAFDEWLDEHHADTPGIWIRFAKKGSGIPSVTMRDAMDVALCYGWIDSRLQPVDDDHYILRFQPRRPKSNWSARNRAAAERLIAEGRMRPAGLAEIERARADGRWDQ